VNYRRVFAVFKAQICAWCAGRFQHLRFAAGDGGCGQTCQKIMLQSGRYFPGGSKLFSARPIAKDSALTVLHHARPQPCPVRPAERFRLSRFIASAGSSAFHNSRGLTAGYGFQGRRAWRYNFLLATSRSPLPLSFKANAVAH